MAEAARVNVPITSATGQDRTGRRADGGLGTRITRASEARDFPLFGTIVTVATAPFLLQFNIPAIFSEYHGKVSIFTGGWAGGVSSAFAIRSSAAGSRRVLPAQRDIY